YILCGSDNETLSLKELLALADPGTLELWNKLGLGYTEVSGHPLLKAEIAKLYSHLQSQDVLTFAGAGEGLFTLMHVLVQKGDHVIAPAFGYQSLKDLPQKLGAELSLFPICERDDGWHFDPDDLAALMRPDTRLIVINFPHNPTSAHIDRAMLHRIIQYAQKSGAYLFSDEVYRFSE